jgi:hypothetical protein
MLINKKVDVFGRFRKPWCLSGHSVLTWREERNLIGTFQPGCRASAETSGFFSGSDLGLGDDRA